MLASRCAQVSKKKREILGFCLRGSIFQQSYASLAPRRTKSGPSWHQGTLKIAILYDKMGPQDGIWAPRCAQKAPPSAKTCQKKASWCQETPIARKYEKTKENAPP